MMRRRGEPQPQTEIETEQETRESTLQPESDTSMAQLEQDLSLDLKKPDSLMVHIGEESMELDETVFEPERFVDVLLEMAQNPERFSPEELSKAVEDAALLLKKLEFRATLAKPAALPVIAWIAAVFMPEVRKVVAEHIKARQRKNNADTILEQVRRTVHPLVEQLQVSLHMLTIGGTPEERERKKIELLEEVRALEEANSNIERLKEDELFTSPFAYTSLVYDTYSSKQEIDSRVAYVLNKMPNGRIRPILKIDKIDSTVLGMDFTHYTVLQQGPSSMDKLSEFISELSSYLLVGGVSMQDVRLNPLNLGELKFGFNDTGERIFRYYEFSPLLVKMKIAISQFEKVLKQKKEELDKMQ